MRKVNVHGSKVEADRINVENEKIIERIKNTKSGTTVK